MFPPTSYRHKPPSPSQCIFQCEFQQKVATRSDAHLTFLRSLRCGDDITGEDASRDVQWNKDLITDMLIPAYIELLLQLTDLVGTSFDEYWKYWPKTNVPCPLFENFLHGFYEMASSRKLFPYFHSEGKWRELEGMYYFEDSPEVVKKVVATNPHDFSVIHPVPDCILELVRPSINPISPSVVVEILHHGESVEKVLNGGDKQKLLEYICEEGESLNGLELLLLDSRKFATLTVVISEQPFIAKTKNERPYEEILQIAGLSDRLVSRKILKRVRNSLCPQFIRELEADSFRTEIQDWFSYKNITHGSSCSESLLELLQKMWELPENKEGLLDSLPILLVPENGLNRLYTASEGDLVFFEESICTRSQICKLFDLFSIKVVAPQLQLSKYPHMTSVVAGKPSEVLKTISKRSRNISDEACEGILKFCCEFYQNLLEEKSLVRQLPIFKTVSGTYRGVNIWDDWVLPREDVVAFEVMLKWRESTDPLYKWLGIRYLKPEEYAEKFVLPLVDNTDSPHYAELDTALVNIITDPEFPKMRKLIEKLKDTCFVPYISDTGERLRKKPAELFDKSEKSLLQLVPASGFPDEPFTTEEVSRQLRCMGLKRVLTANDVAQRARMIADTQSEVASRDLVNYICRTIGQSFTWDELKSIPEFLTLPFIIPYTPTKHDFLPTRIEEGLVSFLDLMCTEDVIVSPLDQCEVN